MVHIN